MEKENVIGVSKQININQHNIEISRNSRGWTFSVKAYGENEEEIRNNLKMLLRIAREVIEEERNKESD